MKPTFLLLAATAALASGCAHHVRRAPALSQPPAATPVTDKTSAPSHAPARKDLLERTGDAAWNVVSAPVRLVLPPKKPKTTPPPPPQYAPTQAVFLPRTWQNTPATRPAESP